MKSADIDALLDNMSPASFKFRGSSYLAVAIALIFCFFVFLTFAIEQTRHGPLSSGEMFMGVVCLFFAAIFVIHLRQTSTVQIDGDSISRSLFGFTWYKLRWSGVESIKFLAFPAIQKLTRLVIVYPATSKHRLRFGSTSISDQVEDFDRFASLVKQVAARYTIAVEQTSRFPDGPSA